MRRHLPIFLLLALGGLFPLARAEEIVVIVHPGSPLRELTREQLSDLYLGRLRAIGSSERLLVLDQPRDSALRARFFRHLNGMELRRVNAYWARLQFSGDATPPVPLPDSRSVVDQVRRNPLAIGYVEAEAVTDQVRTVLNLGRR